MFVDHLSSETMFPTNYKIFFRTLTNLPHGDSWLWNQSNAKVNVNLPECDVLMQKMNTRRRKNGPKAPFYKIWLFSLKEKSSDNICMYFIWCEKGAESANSRKNLQNQQQTSPIACDTFAVSRSSPVSNPVHTEELFNQYAPLMNISNSDLLDIESILWPEYEYIEDFVNYSNSIDPYGIEEYSF